MKEVTDKDLQHNVEELLGEVVCGKTLIVVAEEGPVAELIPHAPISRDERTELLHALAAERSAREPGA
jgi:antitoxin (DNA-binding transcriptional repressor) of toxin-antitoxin stability system